MDTAMDHARYFDVLVIGSGAAGLDLALSVAGRATVGVITKGPLKESSTFYAQGGIAAVLDHADTIESHIEDTLAAGGGLCDPEAVRFVVENGHEAITRLDRYGVKFSRRQDSKGREEYHLTREGGHSHRRVAHSADATGKAIESTLERQVRANPDIAILENHIAVDLIRERRSDGRRCRCIGAYAFDLHTESVVAFRSRVVVLATGGASKVYLYTSNPDGNTGDGIAMAWRAGCRVANMEFSQFHPTCLYHPEAKSFLLTEALRGEGALLLRPDGTRFMDRYHPMAELAPRDVVARAIDHEMKRLGADCMYLEISHKPADFIKDHFPNVLAKCLEYGFDITREPVPVVPAAHYTCGGVMSDLAGRTDVPGLYAIGEVAFTGLHGANRMASNSLLECLVFSAAASRDILGDLPRIPEPPEPAPWDESWVTDPDELVVVSHNWEELRRFMWDYVGIVRTDKRLQRAKHRVDTLLSEINEFYGNFRVNNDLLELRNLAVVADLIIRSATARQESRGLHYTLDHPAPDDALPPHNTVLVPGNYPWQERRGRPQWRDCP